MSYLEELNDVQRKAATHVEGPVMVLAGAGSGKTRVLTYRIAHLIESGVDPFNILSLTFTNKAAREMKARISRLVGEGYAKALWMGTFHSIFAKILRFEADKIGYPSNFTIYDMDDSKSLLKTIIKELKLDDKVYKPNLVQRRISAAKNGLISAFSIVPTVPLPFILLIFLVIFYSVYMLSENLSDINSDRFTKDLNNLIDIFIRKIYYFFTI